MKRERSTPKKSRPRKARGAPREKGEALVRLGAALEMALLGAWELDLATHEAWRSPLHDRIFGYPSLLPAWSFEIFLEHVEPEDRIGVREKFEAAVAKGSEWNFECRIRRADGERRWIWAKGTPRQERGKPRSMFGIVQDITDRKKVEQDLLESEARLAFAQEAAGSGVWDWDMPSGRLNWSRQLFDLFGLDSGEGTARFENWDRVLHPQDKDDAYARMQRAIEAREQLSSEYRIVRPDGGVRWIQALGRAQYDKAGKAQRMAGICIDITGRKRAESLLEAEKERLAVTLRSIGDGVITTDTEGRVVLVNKAAEAFTGWPQAEAVGRPLQEVFAIVHEMTRERCENPVAKVLRTGEVVELANHTVLVARDGRERIIADSGAPIHGTDGKTLGVVLVFRDITERETLYQNLRRTEKLESLGVLAGGIAHDVNNLLGGLYGYLEAARAASASGSEADAFLAKAESTFDRAKDLTRQLLTFSKGGAPRREAGSLAPLLREAVPFALSGSAVSCAFDLREPLPLIAFDPNQLGQVVDNLVINAVQAMPKGGRLLVSAEAVSLPRVGAPALPAGPYVRLSFADTGVGIPPEQLTRIFDPFFTTKKAGSGLGLAIVHSIIRKHDGDILVRSEPGRGTTFELYLPACPGEAAVPKPAPATQARGNSRILVVDDEDYLRESIAEALKSLGYFPDTAADGREGIAKVRAARESGRPFSAVLIDLTIPGGLSGQEALPLLRAEAPELLVFVCSGYSESPVLQRPKDFGFTDGLLKPFNRAQLGAVLARYLG